MGTVTADPAHAARWSGVIGSSFGLLQFRTAPLLGRLADRYGRRPVLRTSARAIGPVVRRPGDRRAAVLGTALSALTLIGTAFATTTSQQPGILIGLDRWPWPWPWPWPPVSVPVVAGAGEGCGMRVRWLSCRDDDGDEPQR